MYYCVREGFASTKERSEGFCDKTLTVTSEMFNGQAIIDGWCRVNISLGCTFNLEADSKHALRVLKLD